MTACASRAIALRRLPPSIEHKVKSASLFNKYRKRTRILLALPSPLCISPPECPPFNPFTSILKYNILGLVGRCSQWNTACVSFPPAQPIKISPSSSLSRFNRISPVMKPFSRALAPVRPVSSSTVNRHSIGPCSISSEARIASSAATPIPLSAPSVVPLARSQSPSTIVSIGSLSKS